MNRRRFLQRFVQFSSFLIAGLLSLPILRFLTTSVNDVSSDWYPVTDVSALSEEVNQVSFIRPVRDGWLSRPVEEFVWVRKKADGTYVVYEPHCTHLGCAYSWNPQKREFDCPCHGGKFNIDGEKIAGPPPRPLDRYESRVEGGVLKITRQVKA